MSSSKEDMLNSPVEASKTQIPNEEVPVESDDSSCSHYQLHMIMWVFWTHLDRNTVIRFVRCKVSPINDSAVSEHLCEFTIDDSSR
jgi:hypothetical protein